MTRQELEQTIIQFMDTYTTVTLACCSEDVPWAAAVYYARQGWDLIFFSSPQSRHSEIFARNPRASGTIHGEYTRWQDIKGLQLEGRVEPIASTWALAKATATYLRRYPFVRQFLSEPRSVSAEVATKIAKVALYLFRLQSIRYVNNEAGFGNRWKLEIRDGRPFGEAVLD